MLSNVFTFIFVGFSCGVLIGSVGVGGILLVPLLTFVSSIPLHEAVAASMGAYIVSGFIGAWAFARRGAVDWGDALPLSIGAAPGALGGAFAAGIAPPLLIETFIALAAVLSGLQSLRRSKRQTEPEIRRLGSRQAISIGAAVGFLSALTATGGPVALMPVLLRLRVAPLAAVGLAQFIQVPISLFATAANLATGTFNLEMAILIAVGLSGGSLLGARFAQSVKPEHLRQLVAAMLVGVGVLMCLKVGVGLGEAMRSARAAVK